MGKKNLTDADPANQFTGTDDSAAFQAAVGEK